MGLSENNLKGKVTITNKKYEKWPQNCSVNIVQAGMMGKYVRNIKIEQFHRNVNIRSPHISSNS